ncbi:hypothetical protein [Streptomyces cyanogenus]|uniref:hypothetical protein n=1 Tax=Streptomyces cyanogenus TaxID=80860 RepID=UPI001FB574B8|nr:hypothetical protein [Streptomyces cyanogenus]
MIFSLVSTGPVPAQRRPRQVDLGSLLSERARELVLRARGPDIADGAAGLVADLGHQSEFDARRCAAPFSASSKTASPTCCCPAP